MLQKFLKPPFFTWDFQSLWILQIVELSDRKYVFFCTSQCNSAGTEVKKLYWQQKLVPVLKEILHVFFVLSTVYMSLQQHTVNICLVLIASHAVSYFISMFYATRKCSIIIC
jgi:flagellar biosynthesis protein FlhB